MARMVLALCKWKYKCIEDAFDLDAFDKAYAAYLADHVIYKQDEVERMLLNVEYAKEAVRSLKK